MAVQPVLSLDGRWAERALAAAKAAASAIARQQATPNMPRIAATGTLLGIDTGLPPTQPYAPIDSLLREMASRVSLSDFFAGAGGSSLGALWAGVRDITAYNHWPEAVASHAVNVPGRHFVADLNRMADFLHAGVQPIDAGAPQFGYSDILLNSPPCPPWSIARNAGKESKSDVRTPAEREAALKKARGSMFSGLEYAEVHRPKVVITENVVELVTRYTGLRGWLQMWEDLGYVTKIVFVNSMFVGPLAERTAQSRDRVFFFHVLKQYADKLDVDYRPEAECRSCGPIAAVQTWKNGKSSGKYGRQYIYTCPTCRVEIVPATRGIDQVLDLSEHLGTPIADRTLGITTLTRGQNGLDNLIAQGLPPQPLIVTQDRSNQPEIKPARPWSLAGQTLTGRQVLGVITHPDLMPGSTQPATKLPPIGECNFTMMSPRGLGAIAGYPPSYLFVGSKRDVSLATGNAVSPRVAQWGVERAVLAIS